MSEPVRYWTSLRIGTVAAVIATFGGAILMMFH